MRQTDCHDDSEGLEIAPSALFVTRPNISHALVFNQVLFPQQTVRAGAGEQN